MDRASSGGPPDARNGSATELLDVQTVADSLSAACAGLSADDRRVLVIIPDGTRHAPIPLLFRLLYQALGHRVARLGHIVMLGTHPPMSAPAIHTPVRSPKRRAPNAISRHGSSTMHRIGRTRWPRLAPSRVKRSTSSRVGCSAI
jgi:nickel-dependent lactate racemase